MNQIDRYSGGRAYHASAPPLRRLFICLAAGLFVGVVPVAFGDFGDADELTTGPFPATPPGSTTFSPAVTSLPTGAALTDYVDLGNVGIDPYGFGNEAAHLNEPACALACFGTECGTGTGDSWGPVCSWSDATLRAMWECGTAGTTSTAATINMNFGSATVNKYVAVRWNYGAADDSFDMVISGDPGTAYSVNHSAGAGNTVVNVGVWDVGVLTGVQTITFTATAPAWSSQATYGQVMLSEIAVWTGPYCGNGAVDAGEECDNGASNSDTLADACRTDCRNAHCGDGVVDSGEACDDGNNEDGDLCSADCAVSIPTVSEWGLVLMTLVGLTLGSILFSRARRIAEA